MHSTLTALHAKVSSARTYLSAAYQAAVSQHQLVGHADVLEEAVDVRGTLDACAHHQPACRERQTFVSRAVERDGEQLLRWGINKCTARADGKTLGR